MKSSPLRPGDLYRSVMLAHIRSQPDRVRQNPFPQPELKRFRLLDVRTFRSGRNQGSQIRCLVGVLRTFSCQVMQRCLYGVNGYLAGLACDSTSCGPARRAPLSLLRVAQR